MPIEVGKVYKLFRFIIEGSGNEGEMIFLHLLVLCGKLQRLVGSPLKILFMNVFLIYLKSGKGDYQV